MQPQIFSVINADGLGGVTLVCEHASNHIPDSFGDLGLDQEAKDSHAAWDPGAGAVAIRLSQILDAPLVLSRISRLVYDLNRAPESPDAMRPQSERYSIPGNFNLSKADKVARIDSFYHPFHNAVEKLLDARAKRATTDVLVTIHSFTRDFIGKTRTTELGFMDSEDRRLGDRMIKRAPDYIDLSFLRNYPYGPEDNCMHTIERHGLARGIPHVMIEVGNDLIRTPRQVEKLSQGLGALIAAAVSDVTADAQR